MDQFETTRNDSKKRKLALLLIFGFAAIPVFLMLFPAKKGIAPPIKPVAIQNGGQGQTPDTSDPDTDGLSNWEEVLYKTDPQNPDSDKDGTSDGDELAAGRHPLKAGPEDRIAARTSADEDDASYSKLLLAGEGNLTQTFLQNVIGTDIQTFFSGGKEQVFEKIKTHLASIKGNFPDFDEATISNDRLTISDAGDQASIRNYFNAVAGVYEKRLVAFRDTDVQAITSAFEDSDHTKLEALRGYELAVTDAIADIERIPVPRVLLLFHKKELWYLGQTREQISLLAQASISDPLYAMMLLQARVELQTKMVSLHLEEIPAWLTEKNISFTQSDKGRLLYTES